MDIKKERRMDEGKEGYDGWMDGWMDKWKKGEIDRWKVGKKDG